MNSCKIHLETIAALRGWWASSSQGYSLQGFPAASAATGRSFFCVSCQDKRLLSSVWDLTLLLSKTTSMSPAPPNKTVVFGADLTCHFLPAIVFSMIKKKLYLSLTLRVMKSCRLNILHTDAFFGAHFYRASMKQWVS